MSWKCPFCEYTPPGQPGSVCVNCGENLNGKHDEEIEINAEPTQPHAEIEIVDVPPPTAIEVDDGSVCQECWASIPEEGGVCGSCQESPELSRTGRVISETEPKRKFTFEQPPPLPPGKKSIIVHQQ